MFNTYFISPRPEISSSLVSVDVAARVLCGDGRVASRVAQERGFPIKRSTFTRYAEILAAPALRRLGRAGLEAPPLRGQKILSF